MKAIAHRGGGIKSFQNTWKGYICAINEGAKSIEIDARLSRDNKVFLHHDSSLKNSAGLDIHFSDLSSTELDKISLSNGENIPRLIEVIKGLVDKTSFIIEVKSQDLKIIDCISSIVKEYSCSDRVTVSSFYPQIIHYLSKRYPHIRRAVLWSPSDFWLYPMCLNWPVFLMNHVSCQEIWPRYDYVSSFFMKEALIRGWSVYPWVPFAIDDRALQKEERFWSNLVKWKVSGLCTNYPLELSQWLLHHS